MSVGVSQARRHELVSDRSNDVAYELRFGQTRMLLEDEEKKTFPSVIYNLRKNFYHCSAIFSLFSPVNRRDKLLCRVTQLANLFSRNDYN